MLINIILFYLGFKFFLEQVNFVDFEILGFTFEHYKTVWFERDFLNIFGIL